jgi:hypothetical protein
MLLAVNIKDPEGTDRPVLLQPEFKVLKGSLLR